MSDQDNVETEIVEKPAEVISEPSEIVEVPLAADDKDDGAKIEKVPHGTKVIEDIKTQSTIPEYTPNYKWKAYDKEGEFDEWMKPVIKTKEQEERLRQLYSMNEAFPEMQNKYKSAQEVAQKFYNIEKNIGKLEKSLNSGDVEGFFSGIGFNEKQTMEMLSRYVLEKMKIQELPPEEKMKHQQFVESRRKAADYEEKYTEIEKKLMDFEMRQLESELNTVLSDPETSELMRVYEERIGKPGAFKEGVVKVGDELSRQRRTTVSPREAANQFADGIKKLLGFNNQSNVQTTQAKPKPVMPNIQGRSTSPAQKAFTSLEDIEKYAADQGWSSR